MSSNAKCVVCGKKRLFVCSRCKRVSYCSKDCQTSHWKKGHKGECKVLSSEDSKEFIQFESQSKEQNSSKSEKSTSIVQSFDELNINEYIFPRKRIEQMLTFKPNFTSERVGLHNAGNTCYLSSVLQCLTWTTPLANYFLSKDHSEKCREKEKFCLMCVLEDHANLVLKSDSSGSYFPSKIFYHLKSIGDFIHFQQEDAHDFAYSMLGTLQKNFLKTYQPTDNKKLSMKQQETSPIYQIFGGYIQSAVKCMVCGYTSANYESFLDLSLELSHGSIEECLQNYTNIEYLSDEIGWKCQQCQKAVRAQKQLTVYKPPNILIVTLKRFDLLQNGAKINKPVLFREDLSLKKLMSQNTPETETEYNLYAVIVHYGSTVFSGHYVAFVKTEDYWTLFDDTKTIPVDTSVVLKQNAYMLFYQKNKNNQQERDSSIKSSFKKQKEANVSISSSSNPTSKIQSPKYSIYYKEDEDEGTITEIILKVEVPMLFNAENIRLQVASSGAISLLANPMYQLDISVPFSISSSTASAYFFKVEGVITVKLPVLTGQTSTNLHDIVVTSSEDSSLLQSILNSCHEVSNHSSEESKKPSSSSNVEEASYSKLYQDLKRQSTQALEKSSDSTSSSTKVGRNSECPCGSGKKYKKCHGLST